MTSPAATEMYPFKRTYLTGQPTVVLSDGLAAGVSQLRLRHEREFIVRQLERTDMALTTILSPEYREAFGDGVYNLLIGGCLAEHPRAASDSYFVRFVRNSEQHPDEHIRILAHEVKQRAQDEVGKRYGDETEAMIETFVKDYAQVPPFGKSMQRFILARYARVLDALDHHGLPNWEMFVPGSTGPAIHE